MMSLLDCCVPVSRVREPAWTVFRPWHHQCSAAINHVNINRGLFWSIKSSSGNDWSCFCVFWGKMLLSIIVLTGLSASTSQVNNSVKRSTDRRGVWWSAWRVFIPAACDTQKLEQSVKCSLQIIKPIPPHSPLPLGSGCQVSWYISHTETEKPSFDLYHNEIRRLTGSGEGEFWLVFDLAGEDKDSRGKKIWFLTD